MDEEKVGPREVGGRAGQKERERARGGSECGASRRGRSWAESRWAIWGDCWVVTVRRPWSVLVKEGLLPGSTEGPL